MRYLVDSDWIIDHLHRRRAVVERYRELAPEGIGTSIICLGEVYEGMIGKPDQERQERDFEAFLADVEDVVPLDSQICRIFAAERQRLRSAGCTVPDLDLLIGATAVRHDLTLLSNNRRHFRRMRGLRMISV